MISDGAELCTGTMAGPAMSPLPLLDLPPRPLTWDAKPWPRRYEPSTSGPTSRMNMATYEHTIAPVGPLLIAEKRIDIEPIVTAVSAPSPTTMRMSLHAIPPSNATTERMGSEATSRKPMNASDAPSLPITTRHGRTRVHRSRSSVWRSRSPAIEPATRPGTRSIRSAMTTATRASNTVTPECASTVTDDDWFPAEAYARIATTPSAASQQNRMNAARLLRMRVRASRATIGFHTNQPMRVMRSAPAADR